MIVSILRISFVLMIGALVISCSTPEQLEDLYRPDLSEIGELRISKLQVTETELNTMRADKDTDPVALGRMYGKLGMMYHAYKSNDGALHYYTKAASMEPSNFIWPYYQAQIHRELNDYETAHGLFEKALELKPNFPPTILNLAEYYRQRNDLVKAAQYFRQSLELRDADAFAITGLAQIYVAQKDFQSAKQQIDKALELQPKSSRVHYVAAMTARGLGDIEKAEFHLAEREKLSQDIAMLDRLMAAISDMAADGKAAFNEGMKVLETGDMEGARLHFQNAVDAEPNEAEFRLRLAWTMIHTGDKEGALQQYLAALPHRPGNTEIHYNMGGLYLETEDPERAIQHYDKVIELDPDYGDAHRKLADLYRLNGEYEKAVNHYKQMIRLNGNDPESRFGYALMHARLG